MARLLLGRYLSELRGRASTQLSPVEERRGRSDRRVRPSASRWLAGSDLVTDLAPRRGSPKGWFAEWTNLRVGGPQRVAAGTDTVHNILD